MANIFDQYQPKSALARSLNEAFAGIDTWSVSPRRRRFDVDGPDREMHTSRGAAARSEAPNWVQEAPPY